VSIVVYDGDKWSVVLDIDSVLSSQLHVASPAASPPMGVDSGSMSSTESSDGAPACSKLLHTAPLPFLDDSKRVIAAVPLHALKPMNMLLGKWC